MTDLHASEEPPSTHHDHGGCSASGKIYDFIHQPASIVLPPALSLIHI